MNCMICNTAMRYFFSKTFNVFELEQVDYWKCPGCGFCASKTHLDMSDAQWARLNDAFHAETHYTEENPYNRNQRYFNQALMVSLMTRHQLLRPGAWLDWGCGIGRVAALLDQYFDLELLTYDKYFTPLTHPINLERLLPGAFELVVNTAVFEHVRGRETLDEIESYVSPAGRFAIHTLVPENVPCNPDWMYLLPVHCAFHTNRSMQLLMNDWGYQCSVYNEHAKLWVLFREPAAHIQPAVEALNKSIGWQYLHFKSGFMDYWK